MVIDVTVQCRKPIPISDHVTKVPILRNVLQYRGLLFETLHMCVGGDACMRASGVDGGIISVAYVCTCV